MTERADSARVRTYLREELDTLGLRVPFEFAVANYAGTLLYKSPGFQTAATDRDNMFIQTLFPNDGAEPAQLPEGIFPYQVRLYLLVNFFHGACICIHPRYC